MNKKSENRKEGEGRSPSPARKEIVLSDEAPPFTSFSVFLPIKFLKDEKFAQDLSLNLTLYELTFHEKN